MHGQPFNIDQLTAVFDGLFANHPAHIALMSFTGDILAVNPAWRRFGATNGLREDYEFVGSSYLTACQPAVETGDPFAGQATIGLLELMMGSRSKFTLVYPCHSPVDHRWFRMWAQPQTPQVKAIVVAHLYLGASPPAQDISGDQLAALGTSPFTQDATPLPWTSHDRHISNRQGKLYLPELLPVPDDQISLDMRPHLHL